MENKTKSKSKFWKTLSILCMTLMFLSSGVFLSIAIAASSSSFNVGGNVSFTVNDVFATVEYVSLSGSTTAKGSNQCQKLTWNADGEPTAAQTGSWSGLNFTFKNTDGEGKFADIVFKYKITNTSQNGDSMYVKFSNPTATKKDNINMSASATGATPVSGVYTLVPNSSLEIAVTFSLTNKTVASSLENWTMKVEISRNNSFS